MPEITLQVDSAHPQDQGLGKIRLDPESMEALSVHPGDFVDIIGKTCSGTACAGNTCTKAKVWRALPADWGQKKARIDKYTRANAGVLVGDSVTVRKTEQVIPAAVLTLIPPDDIPEEHTKEVFFDVDGLTNMPVSAGDILPVRTVLPVPNNTAEFKVESVSPEGACIITSDTVFELTGKSGFTPAKKITYEDIGGLKAELSQVREMIELPIRHPEIFKTLGVESPKGVLLHGPPGTGKTLIAKAVASETNANFYTIAGPEIISKFYGESEEKLREIFDEAAENAPSIIFIDELDSIAPRREDVTGEVERRIVAQLLTMLDGIGDRGQVIVIGATNRPDAIDPALRRPGRFDREIEIGVPSEEDRLEILRIHTRNMPLEGAKRLHSVKKATKRTEEIYEEKREKLLTTLSRITRGFTGADLSLLVREASLIALRRQIKTDDIGNDPVPEEELVKLEVTKEDFTAALRGIIPSAMREIAVETAGISWSDIGGYADVLQDIKEAVCLPLTDKSRFTSLGIKPPKGVLLYGPPGTGKTLIAKAAAEESGANFIAVKGPELLSKWVGESERAVRQIFKKARQAAPAIVFFDEIDALTRSRGGESSEVAGSVLNQILTEMDGIEELNDVLVLAASNRPDIIDAALLRSGRFDRLIYIAEPDKKDRRAILEVQTKTMPLTVTNRRMFFEELAASTEGFTGADLASLVREAAMRALRKGEAAVSEEDFAEARSFVHPTMNPRVKEYYEGIRTAFKGGLPKEVQTLPEYQ